VQLVKAKADVILCTGDVAVRAAQEATTTIPILGVTDDMVGQNWCARWLGQAAIRQE